MVFFFRHYFSNFPVISKKENDKPYELDIYSCLTIPEIIVCIIIYNSYQLLLSIPFKRLPWTKFVSTPMFVPQCNTERNHQSYNVMHSMNTTLVAPLMYYFKRLNYSLRL